MGKHRLEDRPTAREYSGLVPLHPRDAYPHWWDEFNAPRSTPPEKPRRPRWPLIVGAMVLIGLSIVLAYPPALPLSGN